MKFKRIEIHGFKSFADKTEVCFESGVTGIVGPNGCGKSNVADAIRWVMGEQSAKSLRGSVMQDIIFNGTEKRPAQSFSEVSLVFDNTEKIFPQLAFDEVVFSRKLYRSGESEYAINKSPCRLKDLLDTFRDSGAGKEGYSIIGQGRIDELLSARPEDRRAVFEEAAGIAKFKYRKIEAERKLERTRMNLTRISDILRELEIQLGPLKQQAEIAKTYLELKERLKLLEVNIYVYQYDNASSQKELLKVKLSAISEELDVKQSEFEKAVEDFDRAISDIKGLDEKIESLRDELLEQTVSLEKNVGETKLLSQRKESLENELLKIDGKIEDLNQDISDYSCEIETAEDKIKFRKIESDELKRKLDLTTSNYLSIVDKINSSEKTSEFSGDQVVNALGELSDVKVEISSLSTEKKTIANRVVEIENRKLEIVDKLTTYKTELSEVDSSLKILANRIEKQKVESDKNSVVYNEQTSKLSNLSKEIDDTSVKYHSMTSRNRLLKEMQEHNEGLAPCVQKLLNDAKNDDELSDLIVGVVANLLSVDKKFETAIEVALGSNVSNIVTKTPEDAERLITYLKQKMYGRATFLPISSVRERTLLPTQKQYLKNSKCYGVADELVKFDRALAPVFSSLLGGTVVVEDLQTAIDIAKRSGFSFKIVTLDGDVVFTQGSLSGGSKRETAGGIIGREKEIEKNEKIIIDTSTKLSRLIEQKENCIELQSEALRQMQSASSEIHKLEVEKVQKSDSISKIKSLIDELSRETDVITLEFEGLTKRTKEIDSLLGDLAETSETIETKKETATKTKKQIQDEYEILKTERMSLLDEMSDLKVKVAEFDTELSALSDIVSKSKNEIANTNFIIRESKLERQTILSNIERVKNSIALAEAKSAQSEGQKKLQFVRDKLANLDSYKQDLQSKMKEADLKKMQLSAEIQKLSDKKTKEEMNLSKIDLDVEQMQEKIWEDYGLTYGNAVVYKQDDFVLNKGLSESAKIKRQITELGPVNVNSIEDVKDVGSRFEDLSAQQNDLISAEKDLVKIIAELVKQMESRFKEQFDKINSNFKQVFKELFGGGRAELKLQEEENLLETGIDIIAEPPGKKLQSILLLSGGEKAMTAIAILFAILKLRPMPFCVLDEIEAALDDANAERFAKYLKRFSESTQFIVITHRKPTMELADCLYGVTMEEKGVSKMVSVKLSDAIKSSKEAG